ncbi:MAG: hypothetical protein AAFX05_07820 [Planctomycetota bacterium]
MTEVPWWATPSADGTVDRQLFTVLRVIRRAHFIDTACWTDPA